MINKEYLLNIDKLLLDESISQFVEEKLKHNPKSNYLYNKKLPQDLEKMDKDKIISLMRQLFVDHHRVCRENEEFRTKNFKQYLKLKKLGAD
ncbi:hypothetical protein ACFL0U_01900 [Pseudomonadota bacterium]